MPRAARKSAAPARRRRRSPALVARAAEINARLTERYPQVTTALHYSSAWELLVAARYLLEHHNGEVPDRMEDLVKLPGVGRKTANVVLGSFFSRNDGVVVDTHVARLSRRLGLTRDRKSVV